MYFRNFLPLQKGVTLHFNKLESPSPKDALCQVCLKLAQWFLRRRFLKFVNVFLQFLYYLPLEKGGALHMNKFESPSPKDALCHVWLKWDQWFWRRRWKCEKFMTTTTTTTLQQQWQDKFWSEKLTWAFGSGELKRWIKADLYRNTQILFITNWLGSCGNNKNPVDWGDRAPLRINPQSLLVNWAY